VTIDARGATVRVRVKPRARESRVLGVKGGELEVQVAAPPVDGAANEELIRALSRHFKVAKRDVTIISGQAGRTKLVRFATVPEKLRAP